MLKLPLTLEGVQALIAFQKAIKQTLTGAIPEEQRIRETRHMYGPSLQTKVMEFLHTMPPLYPQWAVLDSFLKGDPAINPTLACRAAEGVLVHLHKNSSDKPAIQAVIMEAGVAEFGKRGPSPFDIALAFMGLVQAAAASLPETTRRSIASGRPDSNGETHMQLGPSDVAQLAAFVRAILAGIVT